MSANLTMTLTLFDIKRMLLHLGRCIQDFRSCFNDAFILDFHIYIYFLSIGLLGTSGGSKKKAKLT